MRSRHQRDYSLLPDKRKSNTYAHNRSFSQARHTRHISNLPLSCLADRFPTESFTLPLSTQLSRPPLLPPHLTTKQHSKHLAPHVKIKKEMEKKPRGCNKRGEKGKSREKKSGEKGQTSWKAGSKQLIKHKRSGEMMKGPGSTQKKHGRSNELKKQPTNSQSQRNGGAGRQKKNKKGPLSKGGLGYNWEEVIKKYGHYLTFEEMVEIKEYKWIYFMGKITEREEKALKPEEIVPINSAREYSALPRVEVVQTATERQGAGEESRGLEGEDDFYQYEIGDHIAYRYEIIESINQGSFGQVLKVFDHKGKELVALKVAKRCQELVQQTFMEITILTQIREKDKSNLSGVVRIKDFTIFRHHICMVFELLDGNLYELLVANHYNGLSQDVVRIFAVQILNSLNFLQKERVIHCDIKPENIVMKTWGKSGIKLVDFGTSCFEGKQVYEYLQSRYYRAPEIILKKSYSYPIDIWSFGCLLAELKIGEPIFAGSSNLEQLLYMANSIGYPNHTHGPYSRDFLASEQLQQIQFEDYVSLYKEARDKQEDISHIKIFSRFKYVKTCMKTLRERLIESKGFDSEDMSFYDFLMKILVWEPELRLKPQEALRHPWITKGLPSEIKQLYTIFHSVQYTKQSKGKCSKDSKSTNKQMSSSKNSKEKGKSQHHSGEKKKEGSHFWGKERQSDGSSCRYNGRVRSRELGRK